MTAYNGSDNLKIMAEAKNYNRFLIKQIIKYHLNDNVMLDFGAGLGSFSLPLIKMGVRILCIEPDPKLSEKLIKHGLKVFSCIDNITDEFIDYVFMLNVLEHIKDDVGILKNLYNRIESNGTLFLYVPAFNILFSSMDRKVGHLRRYTKSSLIPLVQEAGFIVQKAVYVDSIGFGISLLYKFFGTPKGDLNPSEIKFYDSVIFPVSRFFDRLFLQNFLGKNLLVIAHRR